MARRRNHDDGCGIAHASDLLGQRWALLVVRELLLGPKRFTDLRSGIPDISPNVLGQRLRELEESGIITRRKLAPPAAVQVYELTEWGRELEPAVLALGRWASGSPSFSPSSRPSIPPRRRGSTRPTSCGSAKSRFGSRSRRASSRRRGGSGRT